MRLVSKIHQLLQTSCGRMRDYRPNLKDQDEIHAGFRYCGRAISADSQFLIEESEPIRSLAKRVNLSPSRFRHLFRSEMGMSVQSYVRWRRLMAALRTSARGASLTEAAHTAGFADSAHLTPVFRATFGVSPSRIFKNSHTVQVISGAER
jgi:AraC-like DNA-binding protein